MSVTRKVVDGGSGRPQPEVVNRLVQAILRVARPERILLFGSAARGEMGPESDIDVMVVVSEGTPRRSTAQAIHRELLDVPAAVDVIVTTPSALERHRDNAGLIYASALRDAETVYAA